MFDKNGKYVHIGDIIKVSGYPNPYKYDKGYWKVTEIDSGIGNELYCKVEELQGFLKSEYIELVAKGI